MKISVFEDGSFGNLYPLCMLRGVFDIKIGPNTLLDRIKSVLGNKFDISLISRNYLSDYLKEFHNLPVNSFSKDDYILLNGKVVFSEELMNIVLKEKNKDSVIYSDNDIVAVSLTKKNAESLFSLIKNSEPGVFNEVFISGLNLKKVIIQSDVKVNLINYPWDVIKYILNGGLIEDMSYNLKSSNKFFTLKKDGNFINIKEIFSKTKFSQPYNFILDASSGKIIISENVVIEPFTYIKGPVYIGSNVKIKSGSKIYGPCVIGEHSKVSGEIAESVFHSHVNKQHDGFTGHSYLCPFVNLGADTVTSDLKNNYSEVKIIDGSNTFNSGMRFLGSIIGDHSKTSINTMLNTGSVIGIFANLFGGGFHEKYIYSFTWNESGKPFKNYDTEKAIQTAKIVMDRRGLKMSKLYEKLINYYSESINS